MSVRWSVLASLAVLLALAALRAQTLGDLARQEAERRKNNLRLPRVITNRSAAGASGSSASKRDAPAPRSADAKADKPANSSATAKGDAKSGTEAGRTSRKRPGQDVVKDEKVLVWPLKDLNEALARDQIYADALQNRINSLTADFVNRTIRPSAR
jgi:hypothetical protein